ncbi:GNAT family N-acetyltransferase [Pleurocapsales cyanobacterium LEGE 10410]|nr:GNAT family N-acetyltransferase [Pleurocapsales cyanobacterium LEGE 10410]
MSIRNLEYLFQPQSVAVIGASNRPRSVGSVVMSNLLHGNFAGPIMPVNPKHTAVAGVLCYPDVKSLPLTPDLAVVCTPPTTVPGIIGSLGDRGTKAAIVLTAGLSHSLDAGGHSLQQKMLDVAKQSGMRILGPNSLGLIVPGIGLNASFAHTSTQVGEVAFVSQSGALCTAVLDWAKSRQIGFSHFISLGDNAEINFADVLDYLGSDPQTRAILLYIESIRAARQFMSAARGAARNKPVLAIKAGRVAEGARAAASHTGALAGVDLVYDAAIRRAGMLRVFEIEELFEAVETLARLHSFKGDRLGILSNGGGPGVMATDCLIEGGGKLAELSEKTLQQLDAILPATWSRSNPVDLIGDADSSRYAQALDILLQEPNMDALLVMHVPTAIAPSEETARAVVEVLRNKKHHNVLTSWLGEESAAAARTRFAEAVIPTYDTPDRAVEAFLHLVRYRSNQELLMEIPPSIPTEFTPATTTVRLMIQQALTEERSMLSEPEAKAVLAAYGIPIVETRIVRTVEDALRIAEEIGYPVALKIVSPDVTHKSDVGGVALNLENSETLQLATQAMKARVTKLCPSARIAGFTVQKMVRRPGSQELLVGVSTDRIFGPIILFGQGGKAAETIGDRAIALPPLNLTLARELISRTRISKLLEGYRDQLRADLDAVELTLIQISQLIIDIPEITELDINPLLADDKGVVALDARIAIEPTTLSGAARLAIRPYPQELEEAIALPSGRQLLIRPIRPEDEPAHYELFKHFTPDDIRFRFFGMVRQFPHSEMARFTQIDYDREMAFVATGKNERGQLETLGVVRAIAEPNNQSAEFAIIVRAELKRQGLGRVLLEKIIRYCRAKGLQELEGEVLADNTAMLSLAQSLGFERDRTRDSKVVQVKLQLQENRA